MLPLDSKTKDGRSTDFYTRQADATLSAYLNDKGQICCTAEKPDWSILQKDKAFLANKEKPFHLGHVCRRAHSNPKRVFPFSPADLLVHSLPFQSRQSRLLLSCRYLILPAACGTPAYTCWLRGAHKRPGSKRKRLRHKSHLTDFFFPL